MEVGSLADWVSGVSTAGTLATGLVLIANDRRERLIDRAFSRYSWTVDPSCRYPADQYEHALSAMEYSFKGIEWLRRPNVFPRRLTRLRRRTFTRELVRAARDVDREVVLRPEVVEYSRLDPQDPFAAPKMPQD